LAVFLWPLAGSVDFKRLPLLNAILSASKFFTNIGQTFLFTMTSQLSPPSRIQLTLFAVDSPAKTSAPQASKPVSNKALGLVSFTNSCESFAWWDHDSLSWKTSQRSLVTEWTPFLENWPTQGLMRNGHVFRRVLWEPVINVIAGGLLPTPTANDGHNSSFPPSQATRDGLPGAMMRDNSIPIGEASYLNPSFVEEMMGFPVGWTESRP